MHITRNRPAPAAARAAPLLLHVFPSFGIGGAQMRFATLARRFGPRYRHMVVAVDGDLACRERLPDGLDVGFPVITHRRGTAFGNLRGIRAALRQIQPDLLVTSNWGAMEWAAANFGRLAPHLHTEDGFGPEEQATQIRRRVMARRLLLRHSAVVLPSNTLLQIATDVWRLDQRRLHYIPNGIDLRRFIPAADWTRDVPVIGTVAGLRREKNVARLLRAFQMVLAAAPARLVVVGDGPERGALQTLAHSLGIANAVCFTGALAAPEGAYAGFDIFALGSDTEQMPLSLLEAMACGLPVVATDVGDVRAMLSVPNRPLVVPREEEAFAAGLLDLLRDPARRRLLAVANRAKAETEFSEDAMAAAHGALLDKMLGQPLHSEGTG